jgi:phosphoribosylanthranilate isomerase
MRVRVKICGIRDEAALAAAVAAGADAVGFVVGFPRSPRCLEPQTAAALVKRVPPFVTPVIVSRHPEAAVLKALFARVTPQFLQTDAADFAGLTLPSGCRALPVLRDAAAAAAWQRTDDCVLFEGAASGRGELADWETAARLAGRCPVVLAGGLNAGNVVEAIRRVRPFAVDVSSGVESAPGVKCAAAMREFIAAVRGTEAR